MGGIKEHKLSASWLSSFCHHRCWHDGHPQRHQQRHRCRSLSYLVLHVLISGGRPNSSVSGRYDFPRFMDCEKHAPWSKLRKRTQRQREPRSEALRAVLQGQVCGEQATQGVPTSSLFLSTCVPPLVPHWLNTTGFTLFPGRRLSRLYPY